MTDQAAPAPEEAPKKKERIVSLDAFRGFTILGMVFVIAVAAGGYMKDGLPQQWFYFGNGAESMELSTWFHAEVAWDLWHEHEIEHLKETGVIDAAAWGEMNPTEQRHIAEAQLSDHENWMWRNIGVTFTDLIAPWFVFIVGVCIPLSRRKRGAEFWKHAISRTLMLVLAGMLYISLVIRQVAPWWGVLQAIGIAYFCGVMLSAVPRGAGRWVIVFAVGGLNLLLTQVWPAWTMNAQWFPEAADQAAAAGTPFWKEIADPFWTLSNPNGSFSKLFIIHCLPWLSISYGVMTMIGVLLGEVIKEGQAAITKRALLLSAIFIPLGLIIHYHGVSSENWSLCMSKPDVTTSYAFFTAGTGALTYLLFFWIMDVQKIQGWAKPLLVFGANPLLAYFMMILMRRWIMDDTGLVGAFNRPGDNAFIENWTAWAAGISDSLANAFTILFDKSGYSGVFWGLLWTFILWLIVAACNRRNIFWRL